MNMNEPNSFPQKNSSIRDFTASVPFIVFLVVVYFGFNLWSLNLVAHGIQAMRLVPASISDTAIYLFTAGLQSVLFVLGLMAALFFRGHGVIRGIGNTLKLLFCVAVAAFVVGFEQYHAVYIQMKSSIGDGLMKVEADEVARLQSQVTTVAAQIPALYTQKLASYEKLADDASKGRDRTGVAKCRGICTGYWDKYYATKGQFNHLELNGVPAESASGDLRTKFTDLTARFLNLEAAYAGLESMYKTINNSSPPASVTKNIQSIRAGVDAKKAKYEGITEITPATLAIEQTNAAFGAVFAGKLPRKDALLPMIYGVVPVLCIAAFAIFIRLAVNARTAPDDVYDMQRELETEKAASPILDELMRARSYNYKKWLRTRFQGWGSSSKVPV